MVIFHSYVSLPEGIFTIFHEWFMGKHGTSGHHGTFVCKGMEEW